MKIVEGSIHEINNDYKDSAFVTVNFQHKEDCIINVELALRTIYDETNI